MSNLILSLKTAVKSTKLSVHSNREQIFLKIITHPRDVLAGFQTVMDQFEYRKDLVLNELKKADIDVNELAIIVCKGGVIKPMSGGVYRVNDAMLQDMSRPMADHESNLGIFIAKEIAQQSSADVQAIIVDPPSVDEMDEIAKISGMPDITRKSILHTLSQRTVAERYAAAIGKDYASINVIAAHLGTGITIGAHRKGKIVDVNNGLAGDGPMSPQRSGSLPVGQLIRLCYSGKFTREEMIRKVCGNGGLRAYLGTSDALAIEKRISEGDQQAELVYRAMGYQIAREIAAMSAVLKGEIDGIVLTGGLAYSRLLVDEITSRVKHLGDVAVYPGENEMQALANNGYMVLEGEVQVKDYE
ncbi:MAG: butyrate kinase [Bacteroidota bacterium]